MMDLSSALPTFAITLREGVEAALVVGLVLACLKKAQQSQLNPWVYGGVLAGIVASALVGALFSGVLYALKASNQPFAPVVEPFLEGVLGVVAIAMLSWMLIWMTQQASSVKGEIEGAVSVALGQNTQAAWGVFSLIFIAVLREGFETVLFIVAKFQQGLIPVLGALGGLVVAAGIGILLFRWGVKINLRLFFQFMGILLLLITGGLVISALKHFDAAIATLEQLDPQFASLCFAATASTSDSACTLGPVVWDATRILPDNQLPGLILKTLFGYTQTLYLVQAVAYCGFLLTTGIVYFQSLASQASPPARAEKAN